MHFLDVGCNLVDKKTFRKIYNAISPESEFKVAVERVIDEKYRGRKPDSHIWLERLALSFQFLYNGYVKAPSNVSGFFNKIVDVGKLPGQKFYEVELKAN